MTANSTTNRPRGAAVIVLMLAGLLTASAHAQAPPSAQSPAVPQWEIEAGSKMQFEVASVKQNVAPVNAQTITSNIPLNSGDAYTPNGGLFAATNLPLSTYLAFAYKLGNYQIRIMFAQLPKWVSTTRYDIQARASGNPTKNQMRLMMRSLLAERFQLAAHMETRQVPVLALTAAKPGSIGPQLRPHADGAPCDPSVPTATSAAIGAPQLEANALPAACGGLVGELTPAGHFRIGVRNVSMSLIASWFMGMVNGIDRPVVDRTGLEGMYDFSLEFTPQIDGPQSANFQPDPDGPTFIEALKEQAGLKLEPQTGPVDVLVIDRIEPPSPN